MGLRLRWLCDGTDRLNWFDLVAVVESADELSPIAKTDDDNRGLNLHTLLLVQIYDALTLANWQRTDGESSPPEPLLQSILGDPADDSDESDEGEALEKFESLDESGKLMGVKMSAQDWADELGWGVPVEVEVASIYANGGVTYKQLATQYGVSASTIGRWVRANATS